MVTIQEPCFCFQIRGKDVILEVTFVAAVTDCLQYFGQWQILKESQMLTQGGWHWGEKLAALIREKNAWFSYCLFGLSSKKGGTDILSALQWVGWFWLFQMRPILAGVGRGSRGKLFRYISTRAEVESTFPLASCFLRAPPWGWMAGSFCPALRMGSGNYPTGKCLSLTGAV